MPKYLLFMGVDYYPLGGMNDYAGQYDTMAEIQAIVADRYAANRQYRLWGDPDDMWAQLVMVGVDGLSPIFSFREGAWKMISPIALTLDDNVIQSRAVLEQHDKKYQEDLQREEKVKRVEQLRSDAWAARKRDDEKMIATIEAELALLGEIL